jgi:hypothetical protein
MNNEVTYDIRNLFRDILFDLRRKIDVVSIYALILINDEYDCVFRMTHSW